MATRHEAIAVLREITKLDIDDGFDTDALIIAGQRYPIGAVADNQFLKRSGNTIIGASGGGGGGSSWWETPIDIGAAISAIGSGSTPNNQNLLDYKFLTNHNAIRIGDVAGDIRSELIYDPWGLGALVSLQNGGFIAAQGNIEDYNNNTPRSEFWPSHVSINTPNASATGAIRLEQNINDAFTGVITAKVLGSTAGQLEGDQPLIRLHQFAGTEEGTSGSWDAIVIGNLPNEITPFGAVPNAGIIFDPYMEGAIVTFQDYIGIFRYGGDYTGTTLLDWNQIYTGSNSDPLEWQRFTLEYNGFNFWAGPKLGGSHIKFAMDTDSGGGYGYFRAPVISIKNVGSGVKASYQGINVPVSIGTLLEDDTFIIDAKTYTIKTTPAVDGEVPLGCTVIQFVGAVNGTDGINTAHPTVEAIDYSDYGPNHIDLGVWLIALAVGNTIITTSFGPQLIGGYGVYDVALALGHDPAHKGILRLPENESIYARISTGTAGMSAGDQPLIRVHKFAGTEGGSGGSWDAILLGNLIDEETPLGGRGIIYDPYMDGGFNSLGSFFRVFSSGNYNNLYDGTVDDPYMDDYATFSKNFLSFNKIQEADISGRVQVNGLVQFIGHRWDGVGSNDLQIKIEPTFYANKAELVSSIQYLRRDYFNVVQNSTILDDTGLFTVLPQANIPAHAYFILQSVPLEDETITIAGTVYTFKASPSSPTDLKLWDNVGAIINSMITDMFGLNPTEGLDPNVFIYQSGDITDPVVGTYAFFHSKYANNPIAGNSTTLDSALSDPDNGWYAQVNDIPTTHTTTLANGAAFSGGLALGQSPAQSGLLRLSKEGSIVARKPDNSGDISFVYLDQDLYSWQLDPDGFDVIMGGGSTFQLRHGSKINIYGDEGGIFTISGSGGTQIFQNSFSSHSPNVVFDALPTADPNIVGAFWNNLGVVVQSNG